MNVTGKKKEYYTIDRHKYGCVITNTVVHYAKDNRTTKFFLIF